MSTLKKQLDSVEERIELLDVVRIGRRMLVSQDALRLVLCDMESQRHGKK